MADAPLGLDNTRQASRILRQFEHKVYPIRKTVWEMSKTDEQVDRMATISSKQTVGVIQGISSLDMLYVNAHGLVAGVVMSTPCFTFFFPGAG